MNYAMRIQRKESIMTKRKRETNPKEAGDDHLGYHLFFGTSGLRTLSGTDSRSEASAVVATHRAYYCAITAWPFF